MTTLRTHLSGLAPVLLLAAALACTGGSSSTDTDPIDDTAPTDDTGTSPVPVVTELDIPNGDFSTPTVDPDATTPVMPDGWAAEVRYQGGTGPCGFNLVSGLEDFGGSDAQIVAGGCEGFGYVMLGSGPVVSAVKAGARYEVEVEAYHRGAPNGRAVYAGLAVIVEGPEVDEPLRQARGMAAVALRRVADTALDDTLAVDFEASAAMEGHALHVALIAMIGSPEGDDRGAIGFDNVRGREIVTPDAPVETGLFDPSFEAPSLPEGTFTYGVAGWQHNEQCGYVGVSHHDSDVLPWGPYDGDNQLEVENYEAPCALIARVEPPNGATHARIEAAVTVREGSPNAQAATLGLVVGDADPVVAIEEPAAIEARLEVEDGVFAWGEQWETLTACGALDELSDHAVWVRLEAGDDTSYTRLLIDDVRLEWVEDCD